LCEERYPFEDVICYGQWPWPPPHLDDLNHDVRVAFMPPNTTTLIQPMDQGAISTFKAHYLRTTFAQAIEAVDSDVDLSLRDFWKQYNIIQCIKKISTAWECITKNFMSGIWIKCLKCYANTFEGFGKERNWKRLQRK
jgi:hypothetical protein